MLQLGLVGCEPGGEAAAPEGLRTTTAPRDAQWRVSSGTAAVLGLRPLTMDAVPTTAYLMLGERCLRNCAFCAQARDSRAPIEALSRVTWPAFGAQHVARAVEQAHATGRIARACFQVTAGAGALDEAAQAVRTLAAETGVPICVSAAPRNVDDVGKLLRLGAERVTIALDAAKPAVFARVKGGAWERTWNLLMMSAERYPGRIGTHLIVGLGETEADVVTLIQRLSDVGVTIALFAFTPVPGTAMASAAPPPLSVYRRVQVARWLIVQGVSRVDAFSFDSDGRLTSYGLDATALRATLVSGEAFRTAGCPGCNRPYYNERPGGVMYNYARPLSTAEAEREVAALVASLG